MAFRVAGDDVFDDAEEGYDSDGGADLSYRDLRESVDTAQRVASFEVVADTKRRHVPITFGLGTDTEERVAVLSRPKDHEYQKVVITPSEDEMVNEEVQHVCGALYEAMALRDKYLYAPSNPYGAFALHAPPLKYINEDAVPKGRDRVIDEGVEENTDRMPNISFVCVQGVYRWVRGEGSSTSATAGEPSDDAKSAEQEQRRYLFPMPSFSDFARDMKRVMAIAAEGPTKSFAYRRLKLLESKFNLYTLLNESRERNAQQRVPHRDFYNVRKVDVHVHHSSSMNQKHLLRFIKHKLRHFPNEKVIVRDGSELTLREVFESLNLTAYDLSVDTLDVHADQRTFHRFDRFNLKYNPCGQSRLREIFLKSNNHIKGRYLAELTKEVVSDIEDSKYQYAEYRISIYGRNADEWNALSAWIVDNELISPHVRWMIQVPRLYSVFKAMNIDGIDTFEDMLKNVYAPLFEVTLDPSSNPKLHQMLKYVVGFDSVDDESKPEDSIYKQMPLPNEWDSSKNPPYAYYIYHMHANLYQLNKLREQRGYNAFTLRPHCGEAGDVSHCAAAFLVAHHINHGIRLRKTPVLQYFYYLTQIGLGMSPLSNNALFLNYNRNPFRKFFARGLNVTLSTDDPLQFHYSKEAIIEEYAVAKSVWKLTSCDLSEIARNSVLQSGFEHSLKSAWLGEDYYKKGIEGNDIHRTNIADCRVAFRMDMLESELSFIDRHRPRTEPLSPSSASSTG